MGKILLEQILVLSSPIGAQTNSNRMSEGKSLMPKTIKKLLNIHFFASHLQVSTIIPCLYFIFLTCQSKQRFPSCFFAFSHESLDLLRSSTRGNEKGVWHIDDDQIVHSKAGDETTRSRDNNASSNLFCQNWLNTRGYA
jgi:hypothetical protein